MKLSFLCPRHRTWLLEDLHRANAFWQSWVDAVMNNSSNEEKRNLTIQLGAAWEISYELLDYGFPDATTAINRFGFTSSLLCMALEDENPEVREQVLSASRCRLNLLMTSRVDSQSVFSALVALDLAEPDARQAAIH